jgi:hypothetical protein
MELYWEVQLQTFLTSALGGGEWSTSYPGLFTPRENTSGTHWTGGWVGSIVIGCSDKKKSYHCSRRLTVNDKLGISGSRDSWLLLRQFLSIFLERLRKTMKHLSMMFMVDKAYKIVKDLSKTENTFKSQYKQRMETIL